MTCRFLPAHSVLCDPRIYLFLHGGTFKWCTSCPHFPAGGKSFPMQFPPCKVQREILQDGKRVLHFTEMVQYRLQDKQIGNNSAVTYLERGEPSPLKTPGDIMPRGQSESVTCISATIAPSPGLIVPVSTQVKVYRRSPCTQNLL